jgi:tetratricopeptide (TPR) repeat protein
MRLGEGVTLLAIMVLVFGTFYLSEGQHANAGCIDWDGSGNCQEFDDSEAPPDVSGVCITNCDDADLSGEEERLPEHDVQDENSEAYVVSLLNEATQLLKSGDFQEALSVIDEILEIYPDSDIAWNNKGLALYYLGRYDEALEAVETALEINPDNVNAQDGREIILKKIEGTQSGDNSSESIQYMITGGTINDMTVDEDAISLLVSVDPTDDGTITLTLPREIIDAKTDDGEDAGFFVLVDGEETEFWEKTTSTDRTLTIEFQNDDSQVEIVGTYVNSEQIHPAFELTQKNTNVELKNNDEQPAPPNGGGCLIATASFGTELAPQVQLLREVRDNTLFSTGSGTAFMSTFNNIYYSFSPTIADWERQSPLFKEMLKATIIPMLSTLSILNYVDIDSEAEMLGYGIGIILLNVGVYLVIPGIAVSKVLEKYHKRKFDR